MGSVPDWVPPPRAPGPRSRCGSSPRSARAARSPSRSCPGRSTHEQVDGRMRGLHVEGPQISTYRDDRSLAADELRLVTPVARVWEPGGRTRQAAASEADRPHVLEADGACPGGAPHLQAACGRCKAGQTRRGAPAEAEALARCRHAASRWKPARVRALCRRATARPLPRRRRLVALPRAAARGGEITRGATADLQHLRKTASSSQLGRPGQVGGPQ